jgi:hypothetical protein
LDVRACRRVCVRACLCVCVRGTACLCVCLCVLVCVLHKWGTGAVGWVIISLVTTLLDAALFAVSARGTIFDTAPRERWLAGLLPSRAVAWACGLGWTGFSIALLAASPAARACGIPLYASGGVVPLLAVLAAGGLVHALAVMTGVACVRVGTRGRCRRRFRACLCKPLSRVRGFGPFGGVEGREQLQYIGNLVNTVFGAVSAMAPSDVTAGLVLVAAAQRDVRRAATATAAAAAVSAVPQQLLVEAAHYMQYALAVYGWMILGFTAPISGGCRLCFKARGCCGCGAPPGFPVSGGDCCGWEHHAVGIFAEAMTPAPCTVAYCCMRNDVERQVRICARSPPRAQCANEVARAAVRGDGRRSTPCGRACGPWHPLRRGRPRGCAL